MNNCFSNCLTSASIDWTAIIALFVSIFSLCFAVWQGRITFKLTEKHYKKTVEPLLTDLYYTEDFTEPGTSFFQNYEIKNCGPGPAILKSIIIEYNGNKYMNFKLLIEELLSKNGISTTALKFFIFDEGNILASNDVIEFFKLVFPDKESSRKFKAFTNIISIGIDYESIYEDKKQFIKANLSSGNIAT